MRYAIAIFLSIAFFSASAPKTLEQQHAATHYVGIESVLDSGHCSGTAVGPHAILTAGHCDGGFDVIYIDNNKETIKNKIYDDQDHVIYIVTATFADYIPITERDLLPKEPVHMWGNPGHNKDVYREGSFYKTSELDDAAIEIFELPIYAGDSGSGIFDKNGALIAVVSLGDESADCAAYPLSFSTAQLAQAEAN